MITRKTKKPSFLWRRDTYTVDFVFVCQAASIVGSIFAVRLRVLSFKDQSRALHAALRSLARSLAVRSTPEYPTNSLNRLVGLRALPFHHFHPMSCSGHVLVVSLLELRLWAGRNVPLRFALRAVRQPLRAGRSRRRGHRRGLLDLFDLAFLTAALQGHFFLVDGHGVGVGFVAAAGALKYMLANALDSNRFMLHQGDVNR
jgi:hypothetical protein